MSCSAAANPRAQGAPTALRSFLTGFGLALASMFLLLATMTASDVYTPFFRLSLGRSIERLVGALASGIFAGFLEEIFFIFRSR